MTNEKNFETIDRFKTVVITNQLTYPSEEIQTNKSEEALEANINSYNSLTDQQLAPINM